MRRFAHNKIVVRIGWILFLLYLVLPIAVSDEYNQNIQGYIFSLVSIVEIPGIYNSLITFRWPPVLITGLGNIFALLSIFLISNKNKSVLYLTSVSYFLFLLNNISYIFNGLLGAVVEIGVYIWLLSYLFLGVGFFILGFKRKV